MAQTLFPLVVLSCLAGTSAQPRGVQLHGEAKDAVGQPAAWSQRYKNQSIGNIEETCASGVASGSVCCSSGCGTCGGTGCSERPGGGPACCSGHIVSINRLCSQYGPPCVLTNRLEGVLAGTSAQQKGLLLRRKARDAVERRAARSQAIDNRKTNQHPLLEKLFAELDQLHPYTHADALEPSPRLVAALAAERAEKGQQLRPHQFGFATAEPTFPLPPFYTAMHDDKPRILGLENCAAYRAAVPLNKRMPGVEGAFNTGTNVMVRERCTYR